jgi:hypothetical protein
MKKSIPSEDHINNKYSPIKKLFNLYKDKYQKNKKLEMMNFKKSNKSFNKLLLNSQNN